MRASNIARYLAFGTHIHTTHTEEETRGEPRHGPQTLAFSTHTHTHLALRRPVQENIDTSAPAAGDEAVDVAEVKPDSSHSSPKFLWVLSE